MAIQLNKTKSFLDDVLKHVPEDQREALRSKYSEAHDEATALERELDQGISRVNKTADAQKQWWEKHGVDPATGQPKTPANPVAQAVDADKITKDLDTKLDTVKNDLAGQGMYLSTVVPTLIAQHGVEFGEVLDGEKLLADCLKDPQQRDIKTFYAASVAEKRAAKAKEKFDAEVKKAREEGIAEGLKQATGHALPYPSNRTPSATTLSGLRTPPEQQNQHTLDAAVATVMTEMQKAGA